jgi:glucokinase
MAGPYTIGIDLGGTNIKGGVCDPQSALVHKSSIDTEADRGSEHVFGRIVALVNQLVADAKISKADVRAVGVGAPGPMSHQKGIIYAAPNLPGWENFPLRSRLAEAVGLPATLENDANAAAYGEFVAGAGKDVSSLVMLTLGTGIGGGVVLDGKLWRGAFDNAGEIGHTIVVADGRRCPCGQCGCLERYSSASAIAERLVEAVRGGAESLLKERVAAGEAIDAGAVAAAASAGDALASRMWDEACLYLGLASVNLQHLLNPERIVLSGGLINAGDQLLIPVRQHFERLTWKIAPDHPQIVLATLGGDAGVVGAAALGLE